MAENENNPAEFVDAKPPPLGPPVASVPKDKPPKKGGEKGTPKDKPPPKPKPKAPAGRKVALEKQLTDLFEGLGVMVMMVNPDDGLIIMNAAPKLGSAYNKLCQKDARVKKFFENLLKTNAWTEVVFTTLMVMLPIAQNHIPALADLPIPSIDMSIVDDE